MTTNNVTEVKKPDVVRTPSGIVTREEYDRLKAEGGGKVMGRDVERVVQERRDRGERLPQETLPATNREQFDTAVAEGLIPEGSKYVAKLDVKFGEGVKAQERADIQQRISDITGQPVGTWGYYNPQQLQQIADSKQAARDARVQLKKDIELSQTQFAVEQKKQREVFEDSLKSLPPIFTEAYKKGGYDSYNKAVENQQKALDTLDKGGYKTEGDNYNIQNYIIDNPGKSKATLLTAGFTKSEIEAATPAKGAVTLHELTGAIKDVKETPTTAKFIDKVKVITKGAWQLLTPWEETKGESFVNFVKGTPQRLLSPDLPPQSQLKRAYQSEQSSPLWAKLLFGQTVAYDKKTDTYSPTALAMVPEKKTATGQAAARVLQKTIEVNWNKLIKPRVSKPDINWNEIAKAIRAGEVRTARQAANWAEANARWAKQRAALRFKETRTPEQIAQQIARETARKEQAIKDAVKWAAWRKSYLASKDLQGNLARVPRVAAAPQTWTPFKPSELTPEKAKELIKDWQTMRPSDAIKQINKANLITVAVATNPDALKQLLSRVTQAQRTQTITRMQPKVLSAFEANQLTKAQTLARTQLRQVNAQAVSLAQALENATRAASEAMFESLARGDTLAEAETKAKLAAATQTKSEPDSETIAQIATEVVTEAIDETTGKTDTDIFEATIFEPTPDTIKRTPPKTPFPPPSDITPTPPPTPPSGTPPTPPGGTQIIPPPIILPSGKGKKAVKLTKEEKASAVSWPQGFGWWVVFMRKGKRHAFFVTKIPRGIKEVKQGKGEAARGIQQFKGRKPTTFSMPLGVVNVRVETPSKTPGKAGAIGFTPTSVSMRRPRITAKRPRIR